MVGFGYERLEHTIMLCLMTGRHPEKYIIRHLFMDDGTTVKLLD